MILPIQSLAWLSLFSGTLVLLPFPAVGQRIDSISANLTAQSASTSILTLAPVDSLLVPENCPSPIRVVPVEMPSLLCRPVVVPLRNNKTTRNLISRYMGTEQRYITTMLERSQHYFPIYEWYLQKYGLPNELKYISVIESNLNPNAKSHCRATGLWQFMSITGKVYQLDQNAYLDERMDLYKATDAACRYLKDLHRLFGDWELALAAYNCGPTNVRRAIRKAGNRTGFWQIYPFLPPETRGYVPKFAVIHSLMANAQPDTLTIMPALSDTILVHQPVDLSELAKGLSVSLMDLQTLNPHLKTGVAPAYFKGYTVRIPAEKKPEFMANRSTILASMAAKVPSKLASTSTTVTGKRKITHTVSKGQSISRIAAKYRVTEAEVKRWNHMANNRLKIGQHLTIWVKPTPARKKSSVRKRS